MLVVGSLAVVSGCSSSTPAPTETDNGGGGVTTMEIIDHDSGE